MATLQSQLNEYCKQKNIRVPNKAARGLLGHIVASEFRKRYPGVQIPKTEATEVVLVNSYPGAFDEEINKIIESFITKPPEPVSSILEHTEIAIAVDKKRTRKPVAKPAFSGKQLMK